MMAPTGTTYTSAAGLITTFTRDAAGRETRAVFGDGGSRTMVYDAASQVLQINTYGTDTTKSLFSYTYDEVGNRKSMVLDGHTGTPVSWIYDAKDRLTNAQSLDSSAVYNYTNVYDSRDNMSVNGETSPPTTATFDAASRLVTNIQGSATSSFTFDRNGNETLRQPFGTTPTTLVYDPENRQKEYREMSGGALAITSSVYDGDGLRRLLIASNNARTSFIWDGQDYLGEA